jgi:purine-nucleoside/S-methyl-5'-thioadenosine phosphorylase / adenosine deaminase
MWTLDADAPVPTWRAGSEQVLLAFSTRQGGVSAPPFDTLNLGRSTLDDPRAVVENRRRLFAALQLDPDRLATAGQVHGTGTLEIATPGHHPGCDALVTRARALPIAITTADCMPMLYVTPGAVAAAHSGWRGTAAGLPHVTLRAVCEAAGQPPHAVRVHLGPCIRACCYEVGPEVARQFPAEVTRPSGERWRLDLPAAARLQLVAAGVDPAAIEDVGACTACSPDWYFSHRRDHGRTGRHWAIAARLS